MTNKKHVTFTERSLMFLVHDYAKESKDEMWLSRYDYDLSIFRYYQSVAYLQERLLNGSGDVGTSDILGMERHLTPDTKEKFRCKRRALKRAVLEEQHRQRQNQCFCPEDLAKVASSHSEWARECARASGKILERDLKGQNIGNIKDSCRPEAKKQKMECTKHAMIC